MERRNARHCRLRTRAPHKPPAGHREVVGPLEGLRVRVKELQPQDRPGHSGAVGEEGRCFPAAGTVKREARGAIKREEDHERGSGDSQNEEKMLGHSANGSKPWRRAAVKAEPPNLAFEARPVRVEKNDSPAGSMCRPGPASPDDRQVQQCEKRGCPPEDQNVPVVFHPLPSRSHAQIQGPRPSQLFQVPVKQVPLQLQPLVQPPKIETKNIPLTVLPSDSGWVYQPNKKKCFPPSRSAVFSGTSQSTIATSAAGPRPFPSPVYSFANPNVKNSIGHPVCESPVIRLPASSSQHTRPVTLFQTTGASTTTVAVPVPTLSLRPVISAQHFAKPAQTEAFVSSGLNFSLKRPAPVFAESFSRNTSNITTTNGRFSVSNSDAPGIPIFPRAIPLPQVTPFIPSPTYVSAPIVQPASIFGGPPQFPFCHPSFVPGPRCFPPSTFSLRPPFGYGNFSSSVPQCFGFYEHRNQRQEVIFSALGEDYRFRRYSEESIHGDQRICESSEVPCQSSCNKERSLSPLPQLDVEVVEEVLPSSPSTPSSTYIINVTDSDEEEDVKLFQVL
ncbi:transcription factor SOX-30 isoform X2 [Myiozetetes cayanensis]|uniref:transcription factor SOX-30 isoform X2 n=1 Tax=Myiozetetes cayanensis TaxID=478635 RepID=UPI00215F1145|nr:transcription factor SOX-30 isoform X2 [Myiozetetes cayanensis]